MPAFRLLILAAIAVCANVSAADEFASRVAPLLKKHCARCHSEKKAEGNLSFAKLDRDCVKSDDADREAAGIQAAGIEEPIR